MVALPGIVMATGAYVQAVRVKQWGAILVFIGGVLNVAFVVLNAGLAYALVQDKWGQRAILADFAAVIFTIGVGFINTLVSVLFRNRSN